MYLTTSIRCVKKDCLSTTDIFSCFSSAVFRFCFLALEKRLKEHGCGNVVPFIHPFKVFKYMYIYICIYIYIYIYNMYITYI